MEAGAVSEWHDRSLYVLRSFDVVLPILVAHERPVLNATAPVERIIYEP